MNPAVLEELLGAATPAETDATGNAALARVLVIIRRELANGRPDLVDPGDLVSLAEIRALAGGITHRTLQLWRQGKNVGAAGPFPEPIRELECGPIFDRRAVRAWLEAH